MSKESSPFLHIDTKQDWNKWVAWDEARKAPTYRERITRSEYSQRLLIETLRYRWYQRNGTLGNTMQIIGDFGRLWGEVLAAIYLAWMLGGFW